MRKKFECKRGIINIDNLSDKRINNIFKLFEVNLKKKILKSMVLQFQEDQTVWPWLI